MPISDYLRDLRALVGHRLLLVPGVAAIVRDTDDRVLFMRRADNGEWGLPAGAIDPGETPADAVVREVHEETGLEVHPARVAGVFGGTLSATDGEALELRYFAPDEAPELQVAYPRSLLYPPRSANESARFEPTR